MIELFEAYRVHYNNSYAVFFIVNHHHDNIYDVYICKDQGEETCFFMKKLDMNLFKLNEIKHINTIEDSLKAKIMLLVE
jgi:hypothetical protein